MYLAIIRKLGIFCGLILTFCFIFFFYIDTALAHTPHDDIEAVEISPTYDQDKTLFIIVRGNLLKSIDGGQSWQRLVKGLDNKYSLSSLEISPQTKKTIYLSSLGDGIYKSQDEGISWVKINHNLKTLDIDVISVSSDNVVFAAGTQKGLYKTKNGGQSWEQVMEGKHKITAIASASDKQDYIVIGDNQGNLYVSTDGGEVWQQRFALANRNFVRTIVFSPSFSSDNTFFVGTNGEGIFQTIDAGFSFSEVNRGLSEKTIMSLAISPNYGTDFTIFASSRSKGVFKSDDGGKTWKENSKGLTRDGQANSKKRPHFSHLRISDEFGKDQTIFLAGFNGLFQSTNGGGNWRELETLSTRIIVGLALSPNYIKDSTVAFTTYIGGASLSHDQGSTWTDINNGLENSHRYISRPNDINRLFDIAFSPNYRSDKSIFSSSWKQFFRSTNGGKHWIKSRSLPITGKSEFRGLFLITISPNFASDNTIYLANRDGEIFKSIDKGVNFSRIGDVGQSIYSLAISPDFTSDRTLYVGISGGVYKTVDGGETWQPASDGITVIERAISSDRRWIDPVNLAISPDYKVDGTVLAGTKEGLFITKNRGESWTKLEGKAYGEESFVEAIALSPNYQQDRTFIVSIKGKGLFKTIDGGKTFTQIGNGLIENNILLANMESFNSTSIPIKFSPSYAFDKTLYGYSGTKLFKSIDGGKTWQSLTLPRYADKNFINYWYFRLNLASRKRQLLAILIVALLSYLFLRFLRLKTKAWLSHR
jgi:photosystem II stability/assembly factor-like uncharacterized protein